MPDSIAELEEKLRPYQLTGLRRSKERFLAGVRRQLLVSPTGTGKTVFFATLPVFHEFQKRMLVLVHRDTLAQQAKEKIEDWNPGFKVGIEKGSMRCDGTERVVVASVQTIGRLKKTKDKSGKVIVALSERLLALNPDEFDVAVVDEAHHAVAESYRAIFRHFGFLDEKYNKIQPTPQRLLLGVTATPKRCDGALLNQVFDKIVFDYKIEDAIRQGWLVQIVCWRITTKNSLDGVKITGDDYQRDELAKAVNTPGRNRLVVQEWLNRASNRGTICFAVDVQHTKDLTAEFQRRGVKAAGIWDGDREKKKKLEQFRDGELQVLVNCELLTEGFDESRVACVVLARPTASESLFKQMVGRGTRLERGVKNLLDAMAQGYPITKPDCLVLDFADTTTKQNLVSFAGAYDLPPNMNLKGKSLVEAKEQFEALKAVAQDLPVDLSAISDLDAMATLGAKLMDKAAEAARAAEMERLRAELRAAKPAQEQPNDDGASYVAHAEVVDLFQVRYHDDVKLYSKLQWHTVRDEFVLQLPRGGGQVRIGRSAEGFPLVRGVVQETRIHWMDMREDATLEDAFIFAEEEVERLSPPGTLAMLSRESDAKWKKDPATPAQIKALAPGFRKRFGIDVPSTIRKGEASEMITEFILQDYEERARAAAAIGREMPKARNGEDVYAVSTS